MPGERSAQLVKLLREQRTFWHELDTPARRALQIRRPGDDDVSEWRDSFKADATALRNLREIARKSVVGWRGFTEADVLGAAVGGDAPVEFDTEVFTEWCYDDSDLLIAIRDQAVQHWSDFNKRKDDTAKN